MRFFLRMGSLIAAGVCAIGSFAALQSQGVVSAGLWLIASIGLLTGYRFVRESGKGETE